MTLTYVTIKGTVGKTYVDLQLGIPVSQIAGAIPQLIREVAKHREEIIAATQDVTK